LPVKILANERSRIKKLLYWERQLWEAGYLFVAGVDEAGRGPLAGPVVAAAVVFPKEPFIAGITDSKKISAKVREQLASVIKVEALGIGIGIVDEREIDRSNIRQATLFAMQAALDDLPVVPDFVLIDGRDTLPSTRPSRALIKGDRISFSIAAASIIAKVTRDRLMVDYHEEYPKYGFLRNKGYPTREHLQALRRYGPCPIHRRSFRPIRQEKSNQ